MQYAEALISDKSNHSVCEALFKEAHRKKVNKLH